MNYKKLSLSILLSFFLVNTSFSFIKAEGWFSMPEWFSVPEGVNIGEIRDKAALYLGYVTAIVLLEQGCEYCIHHYNKRYADHADTFRGAVLNSELNGKNTNSEQHLRNLAAEFRNPFYRYTIGLIKKNRIEDWLEREIQQKKWNSNHIINQGALNKLLCEGSY